MKKYTLKKSVFGDNLHLVSPQRFTINYRPELNDSQYEAVTSVNGPHLVIAGAGTGKTRTIVYRVAYLVELGVKPQNILLLTFTRKAAQEMLRRAAILLDSRCENVAGGTFHSFANSVLRKYAALIGYENSFTILDQGDAEDTINLIRTRMKLDTRAQRFPRKETLFEIHSKSVNTVTPLHNLLTKQFPHYLEIENEIQSLFNEFAIYKKRHNLMDYDDLLVNIIKLFKVREDIRLSLSLKYKHIMVDEYQDTNRIQAEIIKQLAMKSDGIYSNPNVMVVGDDAQSIYAFRGATIRNILEFPETLKDCKIVPLEENYRSTQAILNVANEILSRARE
ncbi:MAG: ATP-dependent helicase [Bacteroidetes bacterium]|nr:ATP-dependent helicase [Bacteroidota bacterium]